MGNKYKNANIIKIYKEADPEGRFQIMMRNYHIFPRELNKAESKIRFRIKAELECERQKVSEGLGVRVQTSSMGDRTASEAIANVLLEEAFKTGNIDHSILKGISEAAEIEEEIHMIRIMRMDFELLEGLLKNLSELDARIMVKHFSEKKFCKEIAGEEDKEPEAVKKRIYRLKQSLKEEIIEYLEMNYGRNE